jgi:hypothetical protein
MQQYEDRFNQALAITDPVERHATLARLDSDLNPADYY